MANVERPLSPHIQIYKPQLTSFLSILHRMTGVFLGLGALLLAWWLMSAASGPAYFELVQGWLAGWFGRLVLFGFTFALFYHMCNGIRHLVWDAGYGYDPDSVTKTGILMVAASVALTFISWFMAYGLLGG